MIKQLFSLNDVKDNNVKKLYDCNILHDCTCIYYAFFITFDTC